VNALYEPVRIVQLTQDQAETIADWRYEPPYDFYDVRADLHDLEELLDSAKRGNWYFGAHSAAGELIGYFVFKRTEDVVGVGLALRPDLTGRGQGQSFLEDGLAFAREQFEPRGFRLSVAEFNRRAIRVYERVGFTQTRTFAHETNGGVYRFVEMERPA
jgi:[ribosomal protein S18]-alanine N-acetyltransferase